MMKRILPFMAQLLIMKKFSIHFWPWLNVRIFSLKLQKFTDMTSTFNIKIKTFIWARVTCIHKFVENQIYLI